MTDLLVGCLLQPMFLLQLFSKDARNLCGLNTFRRFITAMLMGASMSSIALISYDRYLLLSKSSQYSSYMKTRKMAFLICLCWLLPGLSPLLNYVPAGHGFFSAVIFIYTFLMLFIISWSYFTILRIVRRNQDQMIKALRNNLGVTIRAASTNNGRIKAARAVMVVLLCFILSNTPLTCYLAIVAGNLMARKSFLSDQFIDILYVGTITTTLLNSVINPIIYYLRIPNFRHSLLKILHVKVGNRVSIASSNVIELNTCKR